MLSYPEYKDSGIEWIGEIPKHWIANRVSRITYTKGRIGWKGLKSEEFCDLGPYLITGTDFQNGSIDWSNTYHIDQVRYEEDPFIIVQSDDVLITKDGTIGKIAHVVDLPGPATLNSGIFVTRPLRKSYIQRYFFWILNSIVFTEYVNYSSSGTTIQHLYQSVFEYFHIPIPSIPEQIRISKYLDKKTEQIDSLIERVQKKIQLLKEYRTSLISQCVTKGLNPNVEMKDSRIEWIGVIPENWGVGKLKWQISENEGGIWGDDVRESYQGTIVIRSTEITIDGAWDLSNPMLRLISPNDFQKNSLIEGDIVITKSSGSEKHIGKSAVVNDEIANLSCCYSNFVQRIRFKEFLPRLYHYLLNSYLVREQYRFLTQSTTGLGNLNTASINDILLPYIPLNTQNVILDYLDEKTTQIDLLIEKLERKIKLHKEYRQSLISNVVTGKIRVIE